MAHSSNEQKVVSSNVKKPVTSKGLFEKGDFDTVMMITWALLLLTIVLPPASSYYIFYTIVRVWCIVHLFVFLCTPDNKLELGNDAEKDYIKPLSAKGDQNADAAAKV